MELLVICPSRGRPERLRGMVQSFKETASEGTELVVYVSEDDPAVVGYRGIEGIDLHIGERLSLVGVLNKFSIEVYPDVKYYGEVNDDHVYRTKRWDKTLIGHIEKGGGWGIACGNDTVPKDWYECRHPSACVISGNIVRTLGCFVDPRFQHMYVDDYLRDIGESINGLFYDSDVVVEHRHFLNGKAEKDDNYRWIYSEEQVAFGLAAYNHWIKHSRPDDIIKLKKAMC